MPLGDSITLGSGYATDGGLGVRWCGYRGFLEALLNKNDIPFDYVGSLTTGEPPGVVDAHHEDHSGYRISDLTKILVRDKLIEQSNPDIILLMIGTNDLNNAGEMNQMELRNSIDKLLDTIRARAKTVRLIVSPIPITTSPERNKAVARFNSLLADSVQVLQRKNESIKMTSTDWV